MHLTMYFLIEGVAYFQLRMGPIESCVNFPMVSDTSDTILSLNSPIVIIIQLVFNYRVTLARIMCEKN